MRLGIISALAFFLLRKMVSLNSEAVRDPHSKSFNFCFVISECGIKLSTILSFFFKFKAFQINSDIIIKKSNGQKFVSFTSTHKNGN